MNGEVTDTTGHRERLRKRLFAGGEEALLDHELLEYILTFSIRRGDTKPIAKRLIREFGSLGGVFAADPLLIQNNGGIGETSAAAIKMVQAAALRMLQGEIRNAPVLGSWQALLDYLRADMAFQKNERVRVLHLNTKNMLIANEVMAEGSIDQAALSVREVIRRALELGSAAIILVHNHPSGDPSPSRADIALTRQIVEAGRPLGIGVHDHIIIGADGHSSMRGQGLL